ncbi:hypothetical protein KPH14_011407 [Odynerus spinipes]|uniref:Uncharacterized protein n=1 Tax=Odynerus spinipes TaxID=1348599 RepID=A0AAD9RV44_9HYME|nr:hypothetical protein KPH14_011407 [Odynerus spinipes]
MGYASEKNNNLQLIFLNKGTIVLLSSSLLEILIPIKNAQNDIVLEIYVSLEDVDYVEPKSIVSHAGKYRWLASYSTDRPTDRPAIVSTCELPSPISPTPTRYYAPFTLPSATYVCRRKKDGGPSCHLFEHLAEIPLTSYS